LQSFNNEYANRIHQDKFAAHRTADNRWQSEQIIFRHLKDVFVRMIVGLPGKQVLRRVQLDMAAEYKTDGAILDKGRHSLRTGEVGAGVVANN